MTVARIKIRQVCATFGRVENKVREHYAKGEKRKLSLDCGSNSRNFLGPFISLELRDRAWRQ